MNTARTGDLKSGLLFTSPWLFGVVLFMLYPLGAALYYSFTDYSVLLPPVFIGFENYVELFQDELFWKSPHTLRYGVGEQLYGYDQIAAFRSGRDPKFVLNRDLLKVWIVTYGRDFGTANCEFQRHGGNRVGRQSHTWMRTSDGWRIVAAHVSLLGETTPMKS